MVLMLMDKACTRVVPNYNGLPKFRNRHEDRILKARATVAHLLQHDEKYLPIFLRLEAELEAVRGQKSALELARELAESGR
jgi:hypothetical protein